ncbi:MAG: hypothetical protein COV45_01605 [Deltaproteobacteria bacterium CG11_big_fil_rev_8_21_14_0_20_47_16]|nr:MAG: hypothetical protein COV45_01605 [Deltaproteobacteria bacterium CG11_big_fil_rev_8_21_14_0_20_47_16]
MDPSMIKKIQDKRQEKTQPEGERLPAIRDLPHSEKPRKSPEKSDSSKSEPPTVIEIQVA